MLKFNDDEIPIERLKHNFQVLVEKLGMELSIKNNQHNDIYTIKTKESVFTAILGESWIGYELEINKSVLGKKIVTAMDTDNYQLHGEHKNFAIEIYQEIENYLKALSKQKILVGYMDNKPTLATPINSKIYKVTTYRRFIAQQKEMSAITLQKIASLRPLK